MTGYAGGADVEPVDGLGGELIGVRGFYGVDPARDGEFALAFEEGGVGIDEFLRLLGWVVSLVVEEGLGMMSWGSLEQKFLVPSESSDTYINIAHADTSRHDCGISSFDSTDL